MNIRLICVGRLSPMWREAAREFESRLSRYCAFETIETPKAPAALSKNAAAAKAREAAEIMKRVPAGAYVCALDVSGASYTSEGFAGFIRQAAESQKTLCFIIGGASGLDSGFLAQASARISLSGMTFSHEIARIVLLEQIYRAFTIKKGEPYHK